MEEQWKASKASSTFDTDHTRPVVVVVLVVVVDDDCIIECLGSCLAHDDGVVGIVVVPILILRFVTFEFGDALISVDVVVALLILLVLLLLLFMLLILFVSKVAAAGIPLHCCRIHNWILRLVEFVVVVEAVVVRVVGVLVGGEKEEGEADDNIIIKNYWVSPLQVNSPLFVVVVNPVLLIRYYYSIAATHYYYNHHHHR
jgi:hypothetical protein